MYYIIVIAKVKKKLNFENFILKFSRLGSQVSYGNNKY